MDIQTQEIYSEVYNILNSLGEDYINKLPVSLFEMIKEEKKQDYEPKYDLDKSLDRQHIKKETLSMIALFHLNYWCDTAEEKSELKTLFKTNEEIYQAEIREKYNPDNLFKKRNEIKEEIQEQSSSVSMIEYKEPLIKRIINKIKDFFRK